MENVTYAPGLPEYCYTTSPITGSVVKVVRGENSFFGVSRRELNDALRAENKITLQQAAAMRGGVLYGWGSAHADPQYYTSAGLYCGPSEERKVS